MSFSGGVKYAAVAMRFTAVNTTGANAYEVFLWQCASQSTHIWAPAYNTRTRTFFFFQLNSSATISGKKTVS